MVKKILFIFFLMIYSLAFSQEKSVAELSTSPNPFSYSTKITFNSSSNQEVILVIKNVLGKSVFNKVYRVKKGINSIPFERNNLKSGMYIYAVQTNKNVISKRFVIR